MVISRSEVREAIEYNREQEYPRSTWRLVQAHTGADVDGIVGPDTVRHLAEWQFQAGLEPDGWMGRRSREGMAPEIATVEPLTEEVRLRIVDHTGRHEGGRYDSFNRDGEYRGFFDTPKRDEEGRFLQPSERAQRDDHKPHWASMYGFDPGHVGLSAGPHQVTQKAGNMGKVVERAREYGGAEFYTIFGAHADELVRVLLLGDDPFDEIDGLDDGRRGPNTVPVAGHDVWEDYWVMRFKAAAACEWMQRAYDEVFKEQYWNPMLRTARRLGMWRQHELAVLYDIAIQFGPGGMRKRVRAAEADRGDGQLLIEHIVMELPRARRERRFDIIEKSQWWVTSPEE